MLTASMVLAVMIVPYITSVTHEVFRAVPAAQREAALALGATKWEMIRMAVLPYGRIGLIGAVMLGLGRALGETMAVTMVIGNRPDDLALVVRARRAPWPASSRTSSPKPRYDLYVQALVEIGLVLLVVTMIMNVLARLLVWSVAAPRAAAGF